MSFDIESEGKLDTKQNDIIGVFLFGKNSATLIIPAEIARQFSVEDRVTIERKYGGIFIHKSSEFEN